MLATKMYKNVEDLENSITLNELELLLEASRETAYNERKFMAALKGIDIDAGGSDSEGQFEMIKARAEARLNGEDSTEAAELSVFDVDYETE